MSLIRQFWLLLLATVAAGVIGSTLVNVAAARGYLETQLRLKNGDNAQALALTLSQQGGDAALLELAVAAQFDTGHYESIRLLGAEGVPLVDKRAAPQPAAAPDWFVRALALQSPPGIAQVSDGWTPVGTLEVVSAPGFAHADLWRGSLRSAFWLLLVGVATGTLGTLLLRRIRAPLDATVEQAQALVERRFLTVPEPDVPELRQLSRAMNAMVERLQAVFAEQGAQLEALRRRAQADLLTGLANRPHFMAQLASALAREDGPVAGSLLLVRMRELAALNRELGHAATDEALLALAQVLGNSQAARAGALAGRLNGADFALLLPGGEPASEAEHLAARLRDALAPWPAANVAIGAARWEAGGAPSALMQQADAALVQAEPQGVFAVAVVGAAAPEAALGEDGWRRCLSAALERGDAELGGYPVIDRRGALLHLECPLRLRPHEGGPLEPAARWLPWVLRGRLSAQADARAVALALAASAADGQPRGVNLAPESLAESGFIAALRRQLRAQPEGARLLWLEVDERAAVDRLALVRELVEQLRPLGVRLGLEHAGARLARIERLYEAGLDYVKLDGALSMNLAQGGERADFLRGLVSMLHGLGLQVHAEGVADARDAEALWHCGIDGMTGPWVSAGRGIAAR